MREGWSVVTLGTAVDISAERMLPASQPSEQFNYVGLEHVQSHTGEVLPHAPTFGAEIKSTKNIFHHGQILYGKLRPYLNKVHLACTEGICSTDIFVLQPKRDKVDPAFMAYYLRSPLVLNRVDNLMQGANLPRLSPDSFLNIPIYLPPVPEQQRIVSLLDEADELRRRRQQADRRTADLIPALFYELFGDPLANPKHWPTRTVGEISTFITSGSRGWAKYYSTTGARFIRVQNLTGNQLNLDDIVCVSPADDTESKRTRILQNDLLLSITGVVGLVAVAPADLGPAHVSQHVALVRLLPECEREYIALCLANPLIGQRQIAELQYGQTKPGLNLTQIRNLRIPYPALNLQCQFAARVAEIRALQTCQAESRRRLDDLFQSMLHRAFQGEL